MVENDSRLNVQKQCVPLIILYRVELKYMFVLLWLLYGCGNLNTLFSLLKKEKNDNVMVYLEVEFTEQLGIMLSNGVSSPYWELNLSSVFIGFSTITLNSGITCDRPCGGNIWHLNNPSQLSRLSWQQLTDHLAHLAYSPVWTELSQTRVQKPHPTAFLFDLFKMWGLMEVCCMMTKCLLSNNSRIILKYFTY